jgi:hypothetical protein
MWIRYLAEHRLTVESRLESEFMMTPQGKGWTFPSVSRQDGSLMLADYPAEFVTFIETHGIEVARQ